MRFKFGLEKIVGFVKKRPCSLVGYTVFATALGLAIQHRREEPEDFVLYLAVAGMTLTSTLLMPKSEKRGYQNMTSSHA